MDAERKTLTEEEYEDALNDIYGEVDVCGCTFDAGRILLELDPTAFRCGKADYEDSLESWVCGECGDEHNDEEEAERCCKEFFYCDNCGEEYEEEEDAQDCCEEDNEDD